MQISPSHNLLNYRTGAMKKFIHTIIIMYNIIYNYYSDSIIQTLNNVSLVHGIIHSTMIKLL